jgi:hypothetical protein
LWKFKNAKFSPKFEKNLPSQTKTSNEKEQYLLVTSNFENVKKQKLSARCARTNFTQVCGPSNV